MNYIEYIQGASIEKGNVIFNKIVSDNPNYKWKLNKSKNKNSVYMSVSRPLNFEGNKMFYEFSRETIKNVFCEEIDECLQIIENLELV